MTGEADGKSLCVKNFAGVFTGVVSGYAFVGLGNSIEDGSDPLKRYTTCKVAGDLTLRDVTRVKYPGNFREIGEQDERVSVVDGYRLTFGYADVPHDLINVKVEQSDAKSYPQDKERVIKRLKQLSSIDQATKIQFADKALLHGFEHYGIDRDAIEVGEVLGTHVLFDDAEHLIITIYFLNHEKKKKKRRFSDIEGYRLYKTEALDHYAGCLRKAHASKVSKKICSPVAGPGHFLSRLPLDCPC